jgi:hypothetical protein
MDGEVLAVTEAQYVKAMTFSSGSIGLNMGFKVEDAQGLLVDVPEDYEYECKFQIGANATLVGSKNRNLVESSVFGTVGPKAKPAGLRAYIVFVRDEAAAPDGILEAAAQSQTAKRAAAEEVSPTV